MAVNGDCRSLHLHQIASRRGLTISMSAKSLSLSVTTMQSLASATAAIIVSRALRGLPFAVPSAISRAQIRPARSSNGSTRPAKSAEGPSGPENQASSWSRFRPAGFSNAPRRISATVSEAMNQILVDLFRHPSHEQFRRSRLGDVADDVGVEEITAHSSTLRPGSKRRAGAISAPTRGERRSASRMPPFLGGSPPSVRLTAERSREASGPASARRRASDRIRSRSAWSPRTSNRAIPRL